jgi:hypothetical protein
MHLLEHGIAVPQADPFISSENEPGGTDDNDGVGSTAQTAAADSLLNPDLPLPSAFPADIPAPATQHTVLFTAPLSSLSDIELDELILRLQRHYCRAGVTMLHGMLLHLGHRVP